MGLVEKSWRFSGALCVAIAGVCAFMLGGCAALMPRNAVPNADLAQTAIVPELSGVRAWADEVPSDAAAEVRRRVPGLPRLGAGGQRINGRPVVQTLALSGGGSDGAFGAGVLTGWSARGDRPRFDIVTGVSAGAIIAPFAFLGPAYDAKLREVWTRYRSDQIITAQIVPGLLGGSALADTKPLADLIAQYIDRRMLAAIAAEYRKGRMLLVGTTNLDAQRPVVWNMGGIAASGHPEAAELFRRVILASAAIPGIFPPVNIAVRAGGRTFEEMHVDGGTTRDVFISPMDVALRSFDGLYDAPPIRRIHVIQNGKIGPEYAAVTQQTIPISMRAIYTLMKSQNRGELYRVWRIAEDAGADFNLIWVPRNFQQAPSGPFDPQYQAALFDLGFALGKSGDTWAKRPPSAAVSTGN